MNQPTPTLRDLFEQALEQRADARAAWLDAHCSDPAQRDAIERLLATDAAADAHLLDRSFDDLLGRIPETETEDAAPPSGTRIGPFTLHEKLGEGGSSIVYRAEREQAGVLQVVALKLLRRGLYVEHERRQFRDERRALAQLRHPGIAHLIEGGVTDAGIPYIALELIDGTPITEHVREHGLDLRQRLGLFVAACRAVEAAHRALIVHRDLKPSNVLVTRDGAVKLLDFGIAKLLDAEPGTDATHTAHRAMTPGYAAPEQFSGGQITTATDVYALGVLLGELMTGHRRTHGDTRTPSSQVSADTAPGVLPAPAPKMRRQLRGDLDNIVLKATAEEPELRYASAAMLADDIERYLVDQPVVAHPPSAWYRTRKFVARHRGGVATTFAFLLAIIAALGLAVWQARVARTQTGVARAQAQRAEAVREFLIGVFEHASPDESGGKPISARELLEKGERQVDSGLREHPVLQADVLALLGQLYIEISDFKRANALLARALSASEQDGFPLDVRVRVLLGMASIEVETDAYDAALAHAREALAILTRPENANAEATANAHQLITQSLIGKGDNADVEPLVRASLQQDQAALGNNNEYVADQWLQLGVRLGELGRYDESDAAFRASIDSYRAVFGENSNRVAHALNEFSNMLDDKGDLAGSEAALRRALAIRTETVGPNHHDTLTVANNLLAVIEIEGRFAEALPQRIESLAKADRAGTLHGRDLVAIHNAIGRDYRELGRLAESDEALHKALSITAQTQGPRSPWRVATLGHLARNDASRGDYAEAEARFREALSIMAENEPPTSPSIALFRAELGTVLRLQHRVDEALVELQPAAAAFGAAISPSNKLRPSALAAYCEALVDHGDAAQAKTVGEEAVAAARRAYVPHHSQIGTALFALARANLALGHVAEAETLLREARDVRSPPLPADDLRVLEVDASLAVALRAQGRDEEAATLRARIEPQLAASHSPYARDVRARLDAAVPAAAAK
jgi:serine/threonine-protein kinase